MAAYITTLVYGNEDFGGYLSLDGGGSVLVKNDITYQIDPGFHHIEYHSNSDARRRTGAFQAAVYRSTPSHGLAFDELERKQALNSIGDGWELDIDVEDGQVLIIKVRSKGMQLLGSPAFEVQDVPEEMEAELEAYFEEQEEERRYRASLPRRRPGHIVWGSILTAFSGFVLVSALPTAITEAFEQGMGVGQILVIIFMFCVLLSGILLLINGIRKKVR